MRLPAIYTPTLIGSVLFILPALVGAYSTLTDATLKSFPDPSPDFDIKKGKLLAPILIPRVPGTPNSLKVLQHFTDFWTHELPEWKIEYDNSTATTPFSDGKQVPFRNFMATRDPPWSQPGEVGRLVLVAHYDSKILPQGFIGATDSAAPCAMLMHAARAIDKALTKKWKHMEEQMKAGVKEDAKAEEEKAGPKGDIWNRGVMVLLLDGEEAFDRWTDDDSLYGARNLASTWEETYHIAGSRRRTALSSIDLFLLLDLLGSRDPHVPSFFKTTHWAYKAMSDLEHRLRELGVFKTGKRKADRSENFLYQPDKKPAEFGWGGGVQDDHIPFLKKGVDILHIIPLPFPRVWHELDDNGENLHMDTVHDWAMLTTAFAAEWFELEGFFDPKAAKAKRSVKTEL
ncbi:peptidase M28 [Peziza echinospora]|nr:peptidase M28 [Peziza echinospora]